MAKYIPEKGDFISIDFNSRKAKFVEKAPQDLIEDVLAIIEVCIK